MSSLALEISQLSKVFGAGKKQVKAVDDLALTVTPGQVYGFLGPNGAGKTTTIRMMLDLVRPTQGHIKIFGQSVRQPAALRQVGALVEGPAFYGYLSGRENLRVLAQARGWRDWQRIDTLLELVDLTAAADRLAKGYSLGMKQRLGLAAALLHDPALVILDEPTNGLDPAGILHMRNLIRELATKHGKTVFLSSHLLNEVEQICDRVAIIHQGRLIKEGAVQTLLAQASRLRVEVEPQAQAMQLLQKQWTVTPNGGAAFYLNAERADVPGINQQLVQAGLQVYHLAHERQTLEDYFLSVTGKSQ